MTDENSPIEFPREPAPRVVFSTPTIRVVAVPWRPDVLRCVGDPCHLVFERREADALGEVAWRAVKLDEFAVEVIRAMLAPQLASIPAEMDAFYEAAMSARRAKWDREATA